MKHPPPGGDLSDAILIATETLTRTASSYAIIGGVALGIYAPARPTRDIDVLFSAPKITMPRILDAFLEARFELDAPRCLRDLTEDGLTSISYHQVRVDLLLPVIPYFREVLDRRRSVRLFDRAIWIAAPEDIIVLKMQANRERDRLDAREILGALGPTLDVDLIRSRLRGLVPDGDRRILELDGWIAGLGTPP